MKHRYEIRPTEVLSFSLFSKQVLIIRTEDPFGIFATPTKTPGG